MNGYRGYLHADVYAAYDGLFKGGSIVVVGCSIHARRKFSGARNSDPERAHVMLAWVAGLYQVEDEAKQERVKLPEWGDTAWHAYRDELGLQKSRPVLEPIRTWLDRQQPEVLRKSPISEAIGYALNRWAALIRPLKAGFLEIDNGGSKRALKPVAISRNYAQFLIMRSPRWPMPRNAETHATRPGSPLESVRIILPGPRGIQSRARYGPADRRSRPDGQMALNTGDQGRTLHWSVRFRAQMGWLQSPAMYGGLCRAERQSDRTEQRATRSNSA